MAEQLIADSPSESNRSLIAEHLSGGECYGHDGYSLYQFEGEVTK